MASTTDPAYEFLEAASVPRDAWHATGDLVRADTLLAAHPGIGASSIYTAATLGNADAVRQFIAADPSSAVTRGGPLDWDPITYLCFSRYLKLDRERTDGFVQCATALLDAGANPNSGWFEGNHQPSPMWESLLYGAAGIAHSAPLTRLLLERGADPNDGETPYHAPESYDNEAMKVLVESGKLTAENIAMMLVRKHDWHDLDGVAYLLAQGADPNLPTFWGFSALHHAIARDNHLAIITLLLDHGADPRGEWQGLSATSLAGRRGRADILGLLRQRGFPLGLEGVDRLIAACAENNVGTIEAIRRDEPALVAQLNAMDGQVLAEFAGNGNTAGVRHLLDLGVSPGATFEKGDGYWDVAPRSTALHVAAWRSRPDTVELLIARGTAVDARDGRGRTALMLAIKACVDSYWVERRTPQSVEALLAAGAVLDGIRFPSGYDAVDELLRRYGARTP